MIRPTICAALSAIALALVSCTHTPVSDDSALTRDDIDEALHRLVSGNGNPEHALSGVAFAISMHGEMLYSGAAGLAHRETGSERTLKSETKVRVASISKMAVALLVQDLSDAGYVDLERDVSDYLGWTLTNPAHPEKAITLDLLLSHTSTIRDPEEYWLPLGGNIRAFFENTENLPFAEPAATPGEWFEYANFNYGIAATVLEQALGRRFDLIAADFFNERDLDVGFNWSGVSPEARVAGGTLYRSHSRDWVAQMDDTEILRSEAPFYSNPEDLDLSEYEIGANGTLFSPQGGMRANVFDLIVLATELKKLPYRQLWETPWRYTPTSPNGRTGETGVTGEGFFTSFGRGVQLLEGDAPTAAWPGETLIGHPGEAYGLLSGAWMSVDRDISFAYVITGVNGDAPYPMGERTVFSLFEEELFNLARDIANQHDAE